MYYISACTCEHAGTHKHAHFISPVSTTDAADIKIFPRAIHDAITSGARCIVTTAHPTRVPTLAAIARRRGGRG